MELVSLEKHIKQIYPDNYDVVFRTISELVLKFCETENKKVIKKQTLFSEKDCILICYANHINSKGVKSLKTMKRFFDNFIQDSFSKIHFLPFYPYSSDDGFSVIDYKSVNSEFGDWSHIEDIGKKYGLMFDMVVNHISKESKWFKEFLRGNPDFLDYFISFDSDVDVSSVFRPRTHKLLTEFKIGKFKKSKYVWTTFSDDQIDLNYSSSKVFVEVVKLLLFYIKKGATAIRLDAIAFIWKKLGTRCIHLPKAHEIIKALRGIIEVVAPYVWIITETNVPHEDNVSYFGNGYDEAHMVYNFTLPPLLLYTFIYGDSSRLNSWAKSLDFPSSETTFFNFTASHDGIGVTPLKGIVEDSQIKNLAQVVESRGGKVNYRRVSEGEIVPYELNCVYLDAIGGIGPFLASQFIQVSFRGVPGIYLNSFIGSENDLEGLKAKGYNRAINREKFSYAKLADELCTEGSFKKTVFDAYKEMLSIRNNETLFSPLSMQEVLDFSNDCFALVRFDGGKRLLALVNITNSKILIKRGNILDALMSKHYVNLFSGVQHEVEIDLELEPYQYVWLKSI